MIATETQVYRLGEVCRFPAAGRKFFYLVPAGAIFEIDEIAHKALELVGQGEMSHELLIERLTDFGADPDGAAELLRELHDSHVIVTSDFREEGPQNAPASFPLMTLVMNLT